MHYPTAKNSNFVIFEGEKVNAAAPGLLKFFLKTGTRFGILVGMADAFVPLQTAIAGGKEFLEILIREDASLICINKNAGKKRPMRFNALYTNNNRFWLQKGNWEFFLSGEDFAALTAKVDALKAADGLKPPAPGKLDAPTPTPTSTSTPTAEPENRKPDIEDGFGKEYVNISAMTQAERIAHIDKGAERLALLTARKERKKDIITETLVDTTRDAALINHATLLDAIHLADDEAKKHTQALVDSTHKLVMSSSRLVSPEIFNDELMNTLVSKSNGTVIQHMTRVFLNGLAFLAYYNEVVSSSGIINKFRITFDREYKNFYQTLLPHLGTEALNMERVFLGGMRVVPEDVFLTWATGFLIHDVGKAAAVEYHEGEGAYNRDIVVEHVKVGYSQVMNKTNYPKEAALITGYHHEYYGDPSGYGYFRLYLDQYKKANPVARQNYCISYDLNPVLDFEVLAFFPAKILEIIDVYDSVTDPNRKYRKAMLPEEAIAMMRDEFIVKHPKIDFILFEIFSRFVKERIVPAKGSAQRRK